MFSGFYQDKTVNSNRILYTPTSFAKNYLIHLQETGSLTALMPHKSSRCGLASYLFFYVKNGTGTLIYHGVSYPLIAGDCVLIDCSKSYSHSTSENPWTLQWAHFNGPNLDAIYQKYTDANDTPVFHPDYIHEYETCLTMLLEIASSSEQTKDMLICEKLTGLLALIFHDCEKKNSTKSSASKHHTIPQIKQYLEEHFREKLNLDQLSSLFFMDKYYLTRCFKQQYGYTTQSYLQQLKITHAKHLLRFSDMSIEEIAQECGMDDANYFSRLFKKIERISPGEFRRSWRNG